MIRKILLFSMCLSLIAFPAFSTSKLLFYQDQHGMFEDSVGLVGEISGIPITPLSTNKSVALQQIGSATNILYIATHAWEHGLQYGNQSDQFISWTEVLQHINADNVIMDTCFSGVILEMNDWNQQPTIIITASGKDYAFNPAILGEGERITMLSATLYTYFMNIESFEGVDLYVYDERSVELFGMEYMLQKLRENYMLLYFVGVNKEGINNFVDSISELDPQLKGFSIMQWRLEE